MRLLRYAFEELELGAGFPHRLERPAPDVRRQAPLTEQPAEVAELVARW